MFSHYRFKLTVVMIMFALMISSASATANYIRLREQVLEHNQVQIQQTEETVKYALQTIEKAYYIFGKNIDASMKLNTLRLQIRLILL